MKDNIFDEKKAAIIGRILVRELTEEDIIRERIHELAGDSLTEEERLYMLWFSSICDKAGSILGKDRQFLAYSDVPEYGDDGELIGAHVEIITEPDLLPTVGGQVFSSKTAYKLGKYIAEKLGKTIADIEKELKNS